MQNTSHAVMAQRKEPKNSLDDFPTPPWATRALCEKILWMSSNQPQWDCWEPACNRGYMSNVLKEYFDTVYSTDIHDYGYGGVEDFLLSKNAGKKCAWIITNPPFKLGAEFIEMAHKHARRGVAMLVRTSFVEGVGRYHRLFKENPPSTIAQFTERVPMIKGRLDKKASTATSYCWMVWDKLSPGRHSEMVWIDPCRKQLERNSDYDI